MKGRTNPIARALRSPETNLKPKVIKNKMAYSRKTRYGKPRDGSSHLILWRLLNSSTSRACSADSRFGCVFRPSAEIATPLSVL